MTKYSDSGRKLIICPNLESNVIDIYILDMYIYWTLSTPWDGSWPYVAMRPEPKSILECSHMPRGCVSTRGDML